MIAYALFPTPLFSYTIGESAALNQALLAQLMVGFTGAPGLAVSNHGGAWHSIPDLAMRSDPAFRLIVDHILAAVKTTLERVAAPVTDAVGDLDYGIQMWSVIYPRGGYSALHDHVRADWSAAYYVDAGDAPNSPTSGVIEFVDPRRVPEDVAGHRIFPSSFQISPRAGELLVFPGWLSHYVHPYLGDRPRVVVSANVTVKTR